ncbi:MAG: hypothetical protein B6D64_09290 [Bacteroidetes bacterium 4484_276]|nr:MAG: hypothetical protein B6D64_09290 [Bacteroidetes bacterium 4484_276]
MKYKVSISERAEENLDKIFEYLEFHWSVKVKNDFKEALYKEVNRLRQNPYMYQPSNVKKSVRCCFITKHNAMYYKIIEKEIEIITIHDTRSDPKLLKL